MNINNMPDEVLLKVASYCDNTQDISSMKKTNQRLNQIASDTSLLTNKYFAYANTVFEYAQDFKDSLKFSDPDTNPVAIYRDPKTYNPNTFEGQELLFGVINNPDGKDAPYFLDKTPYSDSKLPKGKDEKGVLVYETEEAAVNITVPNHMPQETNNKFTKRTLAIITGKVK